jgi:hypothetical protein
VYGPESSGKTTLALQVVAEAQKAGGICAFVDAEHALDPVYAKNLGVNTEELLISQPDAGEQALEIADTLVKSGSISVIVIDSVAALTPRAEIEGEMGDHHVGLQSRLMSQALRKLTSSISNTNTMMIFINQIRMKIGVMFGSPETTSGGNALKFYSSVRMDIRRIGAIKDKDQIIGNSTRAISSWGAASDVLRSSWPRSWSPSSPGSCSSWSQSTRGNFETVICCLWSGSWVSRRCVGSRSCMTSCAKRRAVRGLGAEVPAIRSRRIRRTLVSIARRAAVRAMCA